MEPRTCWEDETITCSEESCPSIYNPALCFEPGPQILEEEPVDNPANEPEIINTLVENPSKHVEKPEVEPDQTQIITENITTKKEEKIMPRVQGTCTNCKREGLAVQKRGSYGDLCASCGAAITGLSGELALSALADCRKKYEGKGVMRKKAGAPKEKADQKPAPKPRVKAVATPPPDSIIETLTSQLQEHLVKSRAIYNALVTLRDLGVKFEFPEVELP